MDAKAINKFPIREYLAARGIRPAKDKGYYGLYHSPLRGDRTPSMKVDYDKNLWIDYGAGEGGTLIDLVMRMERCDAGEAMRRLEQRISGMPAFSFHGYSNLVSSHRESAIAIEKVRPLENPALLAYLTERGIDFATARAHCSGVHYRVANKFYFAIGFCNDAGGWELRNRYFQGLHLESPDDPTRRLSDVPHFRGIHGLPLVSDAQTQPDPAAQYRRAELGNEPYQSRSVHRVARTGLYLPRQRRSGAKGDGRVESRLLQSLRPIYSLSAVQRSERLPAQSSSRERTQTVAWSQVVTSPAIRPLRVRGFSSRKSHNLLGLFPSRNTSCR